MTTSHPPRRCKMRGSKRRKVRSAQKFHDKSANLALFYRMDIPVFAPDGRKLYSSCNRSDFRNPPISRNPSHLPRQTRVVANPRITVEGPFGEVLKKTGAAGSVPFRFSTKYQDEETGLLYYGYRYYQLITGRWLSRDPIGEKGGINPWQFCANNSANRTDLLGLDITDITFAPQRHGTIEAYGSGGNLIGQLAAANSPSGFWVWTPQSAAAWGEVKINYGADWSTRHIWAHTEGWTDFTKGPNGTAYLQFSTYVIGPVTVKGCCASGKIQVFWTISLGVNPGGVIGLVTSGIIGSQTGYAFSRSNQLNVYDAGSFDVTISSGSAMFTIGVSSSWRDFGGTSSALSGAGAVEAFVMCKH